MKGKIDDDNKINFWIARDYDYTELCHDMFGCLDVFVFVARSYNNNDDELAT